MLYMSLRLSEVKEEIQVEVAKNTDLILLLHTWLLL